MAGGKKVLIVEDEKPMNKALSLKLKHAGYETVQAYNGEEALEQLQGGSFDIVLTDLIMPKMDGLTLLARMKEEQIDLAVIVLTNLSQEEDKQKAMDLGAKDFFVKSNTPIVDIVQYVERILA